MDMKRFPVSTGIITLNNGYTMIEVLIALAIFSIGIMGMGALQSASLKSTGNITRATAAWALLEEQAEVLKSLPFYLTVSGIDYNGDGALDGTTASPPALVGGGNITSPDGNYTVNWQVTDDQPLAQQNAVNLPFSGLPAGNYTVSKTITLWVTHIGSPATLATAQIVKTWVADGVSS